MTAVVVVLALGLGAVEAADAVRARRDRFTDWRSDPVLAAVASGGTAGLVATAGDLHLVQLRTRRPLLLDGSTLDVLPYSLEAAPTVARILRDVYGIDFFSPPPEARFGGRIPPAASRAAWEAHTAARWRELRHIYRITQVIAWSDWRIDLPLVAESRGLRLYRVPE